MKLLVSALTLAACLTFYGCASTAPQNEIVIERVVSAPGFTKEKIHISSKIWIAENFQSAKAVIEIDSKSDGLLIGNAIIAYPCSGLSCFGREGWEVPFTIKVESKDDRFKVTFSNIRIKIPSSPPLVSASNTPLRSQGDIDRVSPALNQMAEEILVSLEKGESASNW